MRQCFSERVIQIIRLKESKYFYVEINSFFSFGGFRWGCKILFYNGKLEKVQRQGRRKRRDRGVNNEEEDIMGGEEIVRKREEEEIYS